MNGLARAAKEEWLGEWAAGTLCCLLATNLY